VLTRLAPSDALAHEAGMLDRVARRDSDVEILVWTTTSSCLVAPRAWAQRPEFDTGRARVEALGMPLLLRQTGGDLAPQGPSVLNVTVAFAASSPFGVKDAYGRICSPLLAPLRARGVAAYCASVPESFCDGRFNIAVGGRKLAGTAQRWRPRAHGAGTDEAGLTVLAHASLFVERDFDRYADAANAFYDGCRLDRRVRAEANVALADFPSFSAEFAGRRRLDALAATVLSCYEERFNDNSDESRA
jgi:lipoate-protein ligase A